MHVVPAHRTASLITLYCGYTSDYCCGVRLLIPFSPYHLNTNFGNTKFFIVSWPLLLIPWPVLIRKAASTRWKHESSGFPRGPTRLLPRWMPLAQLRTVSEAVYMIMYHRILWLFCFARLHDQTSSYPVAMPFT